MAWETLVQSQAESYQRLKKWYLIPPYLTFSIIRCGSRIKWSNPGKGVVPSLHNGEVTIEKGAFGSPLATVANFTLYIENISFRPGIFFILSLGHPLNWSCKMHRLHFCRGVQLPNECPRYDTKLYLMVRL